MTVHSKDPYAFLVRCHTGMELMDQYWYEAGRV